MIHLEYPKPITSPGRMSALIATAILPGDGKHELAVPKTYLKDSMKLFHVMGIGVNTIRGNYHAGVNLRAKIFK